MNGRLCGQLLLLVKHVLLFLSSLFALASVFCTSTDFVDILPFDDCSLKGQKCHDTSKSVSVKEPKPGRTVVLLKILS